MVCGCEHTLPDCVQLFTPESPKSCSSSCSQWVPLPVCGHRWDCSTRCHPLIVPPGAAPALDELHEVLLGPRISSSCVAEIQRLETPTTATKSCHQGRRSAPSLQGCVCSALTVSVTRGLSMANAPGAAHISFHPPKLPWRRREAECPRVLIFYFRQAARWQTGCLEAVISVSRSQQLDPVRFSNTESCSGHQDCCPSLPQEGSSLQPNGLSLLISSPFCSVLFSFVHGQWKTAIAMLSAGYSTAFARTQLTHLYIISPFVWVRVGLLSCCHTLQGCCRVEGSPLKHENREDEWMWTAKRKVLKPLRWLEGGKISRHILCLVLGLSIYHPCLSIHQHTSLPALFCFTSWGKKGSRTVSDPSLTTHW